MTTTTVQRKAVGVFAVAATYVLFLLWDQFGFLRRLESTTDSAGIRVAMAAMGVAGLAASLLTGRLLARRDESVVLRAGFCLAAAAVTASLWAHSLPLLAATGALLGVATGVVTVTLAAGLRRWLPGPGFALLAGLGTGLAYFVCNVPWLFEGSAGLQAGVVAVLCVLAILALSAIPDESSGFLSRVAKHPSPQPSPRGGEGAKAWLEISLLLAFLVLVWLDSAAFAVIQETLALKGATWSTAGQKWLQGTTHLAAALVAGLLLQRGHLRSLLLATYVLFGIAFHLLQLGGAGMLVAGPIYAVGISFYSTALVVAPTLVTSRLPIRWRAAVLYGVAGWLGSALGVGMAQDLHRIPGLFAAAAGAVLVLAWASARPRARALLRAHAVTLVGVAAAAVAFAVVPDTRTDAAASGEDLPTLVEWGRTVYIAEGCMACHSQYVRPHHEQDLRLYGPHRPLDRSESPPLVGLRRQGPDLSNVGLRHDADWLRHHLESPRSDDPDSVMPTYGQLFDADPGEVSRGDALIAYLLSLRPRDMSP